MRAQAETLGFVFVFTLILLSVGMISAFGLSALEDLRVEQQTNNVERMFTVIDDDIEDIYRQGAPARATAIAVPRGTLSVGPATTLNVSARNGAANASFVSASRPLVYRNGEGTEIVYAHGAVLRSDRGSSVMLAEPGWLVDGSRVVVPLVTLRQEGDLAAVGGGAVTIHTWRTSVDTGNNFEAGDAEVNVTVTVESDRANAWERYLNSKGFSPTPDDDPDDDVVKYHRFTDAIYAPQTTIAVELTRY